MSKYKQYTREQQDELLSNYLVGSWSYSAVSAFARNEKDFERSYIYFEDRRNSPATIAGQAYHRALRCFFERLGETLLPDVAVEIPLPDAVSLQQIVSDYILSVEPTKWKISKTCPTIEDCQVKAIKDGNALVLNFLNEYNGAYSNIKQVLGVELRFAEWLAINGVDIPLPCVGVIDLIVKDKNGKTIIYDHKSKSAFTNEQDVAFVVGKQAITYALLYESATGYKVDEVVFVENKISKNRDNGPQLLTHTIEMTDNNRRLYEAMLYEPLKRMIEAVSNPDYIYMINDNDNFCDKAELYEFWTKTMIAEVEDFPAVSETKKPLISQRLKKCRDASLATITPAVLRNFRAFTEQFIPFNYSDKNMTDQEKIEHVLRSFGIVSKVQHVLDGYSSDTLLLELNAGTQIASVRRYRLDIANALNVPNVRILTDLVVYDGKSYLAIEVAKNKERDCLYDPSLLMDRKIPIGIDNFGNTVVWDMDNNSTPHVLICGSTGSGKSVCVRSIIAYAQEAKIRNIVILDPKHEFTRIKGVQVYNKIEDIELQVGLLVEEMNERVRNNRSDLTLIVFDEFADAMLQARSGRELDIWGTILDNKGKLKNTVLSRDKSLEENLRQLLQKGRSCGFRIVSATQRASTKIITGDAKVNYPVQICFRVPKAVDSKVVLDEDGAEMLNGAGDGLIKSPEYGGLTVRFQGFFLQ
jgi:nucleoside-triphosphatase THEP1